MSSIAQDAFATFCDALRMHATSHERRLHIGDDEEDSVIMRSVAERLISDFRVATETVLLRIWGAGSDVFDGLWTCRLAVPVVMGKDAHVTGIQFIGGTANGRAIALPDKTKYPIQHECVAVVIQAITIFRAGVVATQLTPRNAMSVRAADTESLEPVRAMHSAWHAIVRIHRLVMR